MLVAILFSVLTFPTFAAFDHEASVSVTTPSGTVSYTGTYLEMRNKVNQAMANPTVKTEVKLTVLLRATRSRSPSTVYSMLNEKSQNPGVVSLKKLCDGLEISLREFFDSPIFDNIEQEIK